MPVVLVLDAGTGGAKCVAIDHAGRIRGRASRRWTYQVVANADVPMVKEYAFDAEEFWTIIGDCARAALRDIKNEEILGVVTTSQREGCVFLDADGREIYAGPNLDSRGFMEGLDILEKLGSSRLYAITGHSAPYIFPIARYLWFRQHDPRPVAQILMINDWIIYRAAGILCSEPSNATESMLFDFRRREWSTEILDLFGIDAALLPPIRSAGARVGTVTSQAAGHLGLPPGTPVHVGGADTQCSLVGAGAIDPGDFAATLGTTSPVQLVVDRPVLDPAENLWAGCHVAPDRWVLESNAGSTGDAYEWLLDLTGGEQEDRYTHAEKLARAAVAGSTFAFVGPRIFDISKLRPDMPGALLFPFPSLQLRPDAGQLLRAVLESIAFAVRANIEQLQTVSGCTPERVRIGGGMSRSDLLAQMLADVSGLPIARARVAESTALGCAVLVCVAAGIYRDVAEAVPSMYSFDVLSPDQKHRDHMNRSYSRWRALYDSLEAISL